MTSFESFVHHSAIVGNLQWEPLAARLLSFKRSRVYMCHAPDDRGVLLGSLSVCCCTKPGPEPPGPMLKMLALAVADGVGPLCRF